MPVYLLSNSMESAVLFLVFNRPETTRVVFEAIRRVRPARLYVAADGPRRDISEEKHICSQVRRIATDVDWPCQVKTMFRENNLGCGRAVSEAITWFFGEEEEGIVIEDDVLPSSDFFSYCQCLLKRYRTTRRVMMIAGCNPLLKRFPSQYSYDFANSAVAWGWASWRRAWDYYDYNMAKWPIWRDANGLVQVPQTTRYFPLIWGELYEFGYQKKVDTWDYQWSFAINHNRGVIAIPRSNLVVNLGQGDKATHTRQMAAWAKRLHHCALPGEYRHPPQVIANMIIDRRIEKVVFRAGGGLLIRHAVRTILGARNVERIKNLLRLLTLQHEGGR